VIAFGMNASGARCQHAARTTGRLNRSFAGIYNAGYRSLSRSVENR
jgi:hypothetical protein